MGVARIRGRACGVEHRPRSGERRGAVAGHERRDLLSPSDAVAVGDPKGYQRPRERRAHPHLPQRFRAARPAHGLLQRHAGDWGGPHRDRSAYDGRLTRGRAAVPLGTAASRQGGPGERRQKRATHGVPQRSRRAVASRYPSVASAAASLASSHCVKASSTSSAVAAPPR